MLAFVFLMMQAMGLPLHRITLGALIIALGLLVDDAIIAVEMMVRKLEEGYDKARAATFAYEATAMPMLTGTLITAVGFLPIGMAKSTVGEYTFAIFAVTAAALLISWLVSVYFVPYLGTLLLKTSTPGRYLPAPRVATDVNVHVSGAIARTKITQRFENPANEAAVPVLESIAARVAGPVAVV